MDSTLGTKLQNLDVESLQAGRCDISSLSFQTDGQYVYGFLTFHGRLVQDPRTSYNDINALPQLELPGSDTASFAMSGLDESSIIRNSDGSIITYQDGFESTISEGNTSREALAMPVRQESIGPILGAIMNASSEPALDFSSKFANIPLQTTAQQHPKNYQTFHKPFSASLDRSAPEEDNGASLVGQNPGCNDGFESNSYSILGQETNFSFHNFDLLHGVGTNPNNSLTNPETSLSASELKYLNGTAPLPYQESSLSSISSSASSESNFSDAGTVFGQADSVSSAASTSFSDFSVQERDPTPNQESFFSSVHPSSSSLEDASAETGTANAPARQSCPLCRATFKRAGDLKRHSGKHLPRNFHCRQPGCGRTGIEGFYRRDKLRAHERQMHGMN